MTKEQMRYMQEKGLAIIGIPDGNEELLWIVGQRLVAEAGHLLAHVKVANIGTGASPAQALRAYDPQFIAAKRGRGRI